MLDSPAYWSDGLDLYCIAEVRETTFSEPSLTRCVISSSVKPSARYSWAASPERFSRGSTAIERIGTVRLTDRLRRPKILVRRVRKVKIESTAPATSAIRRP